MMSQRGATCEACGTRPIRSRRLHNPKSICSLDNRPETANLILINFLRKCNGFCDALRCRCVGKLDKVLAPHNRIITNQLLRTAVHNNCFRLCVVHCSTWPRVVFRSRRIIITFAGTSCRVSSLMHLFVIKSVMNDSRCVHVPKIVTE